MTKTILIVRQSKTLKEYRCDTWEYFQAKSSFHPQVKILLRQTTNPVKQKLAEHWKDSLLICTTEKLVNFKYNADRTQPTSLFHVKN